jgi:hypothetical protein
LPLLFTSGTAILISGTFTAFGNADHHIVLLNHAKITMNSIRGCIKTEGVPVN